MFRSSCSRMLGWEVLIRQSFRVTHLARSFSALLHPPKQLLVSPFNAFQQRRCIDIKKQLKEPHYCPGCGIRLQYTDESACGYIPRDNMVQAIENRSLPICQRCHRVCVLRRQITSSYGTAGRWIRTKSPHPSRRRSLAKSRSRSTP